MNGPLDVLTQAAHVVASSAARELLEAGWDTQILLEQHEPGHRSVSIQIHLRVLDSPASLSTEAAPEAADPVNDMEVAACPHASTVPGSTAR